MENIVRELNELCSAMLQRLGCEDKPLIIHNSSFIPEELIRVSGANAYLLLHGGDAKAAEAAIDYTLECINPLARANVSYILKNIHPLAVSADLVVAAFTDNHISRMSELLEYKGVSVCKVGVPTDWQNSVVVWNILSLQLHSREVQ